MPSQGNEQSRVDLVKFYILMDLYLGGELF